MSDLKPATKERLGLNRQRHEAAEAASITGGEIPSGDPQAFEREKLLVDSDILKGLSGMLMHDLTPGGHFYVCNSSEYGGHGSNREVFDGGKRQIEHFDSLAKAILRNLHALGVFKTTQINGKPTILVTRQSFVVED